MVGRPRSLKRGKGVETLDKMMSLLKNAGPMSAMNIMTIYLIYDDHFSWKLDCQVNGKKQHPYSGAEGKTSPKDGSWKPIAFGEDCARTIHRFPAGGRWGFKQQLHYGANLKQWDGSWCAVNIRVSCPWRRSKIVVFTVASTLYFRLWVGDKKRVVKAAKHRHRPVAALCTFLIQTTPLIEEPGYSPQSTSQPHQCPSQGGGRPPSP